MSALLQAKGLKLVSFGQERGFDVSIAPAQRWLLTGVSGSGKSTLMRTLLGLVSAQEGDVYLNGVDLHDIAPKALLALRKNMGVVFSGGGLVPAWSGLQNLMLPLRTIAELDEAAAHKAAAEFAEHCHIPPHWLERSATQLSAEQNTLLALARALITRPQLLWIDTELVWGVLSYANTRLGAELAAQVAQGCSLVVAAGAHGVTREQTPPCGGPTHWAHLEGGWLECLHAPTHWTLDTADAQTPRA